MASRTPDEIEKPRPRQDNDAERNGERRGGPGVQQRDRGDTVASAQSEQAFLVDSQRTTIMDDATSPRTSFCLLEADDRDSAVSGSTLPTPSHMPPTPDRVTTLRSNRTQANGSTPPQQSSRRGMLQPIFTALSSVSSIRSSSSFVTPPPPLLDDGENEELQELFRMDGSVFVNPDNIAPSLETSLFLGESQIVGQNGTLASLHRGKRRALQRLGSSSRSGNGLAATSPIPDRSDTSHPTVAESPVDLSNAAYSETGDASIHGARHSVFLQHRWRSLCCCWSWSRRPSLASKPLLTPWGFLHSVYSRMHTNWDSCFLYFGLIFAILSIPLAILAAVLLKSSDNVSYHSRCRLVSRGTGTYEISTAALATVTIPVGNHIVQLIISLWIAILCSRSRKRVLRSDPSSMTINLTSAFMLPCYEVIWYTIALLNIAALVLYFFSFYPRMNNSPVGDILEDNDESYPCEVVWVPFFWTLQLMPFLMAQHSVSHQAVRRAVGFAGVFSIIILVLFLTLYEQGTGAVNGIFIAAHLMLIMFYIWAKFVFHARSTFDFFFVSAIMSSTSAIVVDVLSLSHSTENESLSVGRCIVNSLDAVMTVAILLSLRADTRYWLGIDDGNSRGRNAFKQYMRHLSERGMITNFSTRTSVYDVHQMIEEHRKSVVDFSALKLDCVIAQGATSIVMRGSMRGKRAIALKIYTSVQVTDEEVQRFSRETALNVQLSHPNIVKFYGLCVVPPSISLVFEFCEYGGLDGVLQNGSMATLSAKLRAWLECCRSVAYLHSFSPPLLHRDIKTDNFLVGQDFTVKLADFGEANLLRPRSDGTMTIAGTVDYMAPEMILGGKATHYDAGVDVYSLMITLWQIMVPDRSPWEGKTHLEVYTCVTNGERPPLLPTIPRGCAEILEAGWVANPSERLAVEDILHKVHELWLLSTHQRGLKRTK
ncbi:hypothetical protein Poli38472_008653 [Pythium oligandrum]|uniref:Protein kinase domain-containing protein n=1 Tax=Pythium oligandrum TaxID=41045 RepID=A0A8K1C3Z0_PYTOL|nr:hypothetical protein Poli38472_008653 [Pythium oligandrum]|eukprot:TMW56005.1 hypothetical protein Poli38472_008653 [Pythium oligandrum]